MRSKFRFTKNYDHRLSAGVEIAYKAGQEIVIPKDHAEAAKVAGAGNYVSAAVSKKAKDASE